jgi:hypothetical protein
MPQHPSCASSLAHLNLPPDHGPNAPNRRAPASGTLRHQPANTFRCNAPHPATRTQEPPSGDDPRGPIIFGQERASMHIGKTVVFRGLVPLTCGHSALAQTQAPKSKRQADRRFLQKPRQFKSRRRSPAQGDPHAAARSEQSRPLHAAACASPARFRALVFQTSAVAVPSVVFLRDEKRHTFGELVLLRFANSASPDVHALTWLASERTAVQIRSLSAYSARCRRAHSSRERPRYYGRSLDDSVR